MYASFILWKYNIYFIYALIEVYYILLNEIR